MPGRTAASASNSQEIDVYVALERGTYLYDPFHHALDPIIPADLRRLAISRGQGGAGGDAPVRLVFVADVDRLANTRGYQEPGLHDPEVQRAYSYVDTGLIAANVYLFAASSDLAAWFHNCDREALAKRLRLRPTQRVLFGQTVGHPLEQARQRKVLARPDRELASHYFEASPAAPARRARLVGRDAGGGGAARAARAGAR